MRNIFRRRMASKLSSKHEHKYKICPSGTIKSVRYMHNGCAIAVCLVEFKDFLKISARNANAIGIPAFAACCGASLLLYPEPKDMQSVIIETEDRNEHC